MSATLEWKPKAEEGVYTFGQANRKFGKPDADGWRLPTKDECQNHSRSITARRVDHEPMGLFWTSSEAPECKTHGEDVWCVGFNSPYARPVSYGHEPLQVRLVREVK